jgi:hypothetical protein
MQRVVLWVALLALVLVACGGPPADTTVADPPKSKVIEQTGNERIDKIIADWKSSVPEAMKAQAVLPETIEQKVYQSEATLQELADYYKTLTEKSWVESQRMPGLQSGVLLTGYDNGSTTLVVGAIDTAPLGGTGVVVYTAKGNK